MNIYQTICYPFFRHFVFSKNNYKVIIKSQNSANTFLDTMFYHLRIHQYVMFYQELYLTNFENDTRLEFVY